MVHPRSPHQGETPWIFITAKCPVKPEHADDCPQLSQWFTDACHAEAGCLFFWWSRSIADPTEYVLLEAFRDHDAAAAHVGWSEMGEPAVK